ncbi:MAG: ABC transporter ATP-binding protein [Chitinivibrionales bacterium]
MTICVCDLSFSYRQNQILHSINLEMQQGQKWAIIGKNGAGKTTLIKCLAGINKQYEGSILLKNKELRSFNARQRARLIAYVPQGMGGILPYTVKDFVMMGRFAYQSFMAVPTREDHHIVLDSLALTDTLHLKNRQMHTLSGGELQRVMIAGAVSQRPSVLLLDEPATFLDPLHQQQLENALERVHEQFAMTIVTVTHDINTALNRYDNILALIDGALFWADCGKGLLAKSPSILKSIYGIDFESATMPSGDRMFSPLKVIE